VATCDVKPARIQGVNANLRNLWSFWRGMKPIHENCPYVRTGEGMVATLPWEQLQSPTLAVQIPRTLCLRGIPNKISSTELMDTLDNMGFSGEYDYFYLPCDVRSLCNRGYAFVNLTSSEAARRFHEAMNHYRFTELSDKRVQVSLAKVQGVRRNLLRCQSVNCSGFLSYPWVLEDGEMKCLSSKAAVYEYLSSEEKEADGSAAESTHADSDEVDRSSDEVSPRAKQIGSLWSPEAWQMASLQSFNQ
jgi:hypothetical protein